MKRAMARQAEAERERRAKVINAEGELQAAEKLAQAAHIIGKEPAAIQLRYLQTVNEIASENNSTTIFPIPIDLFRGFMERLAPAQAGDAAAGHSPSAPQGNVCPRSAARGRPRPDGKDLVSREALERIIKRAAELPGFGTRCRRRSHEQRGPGAREGRRHPRPLPASGDARGTDARRP